jgi:hypothetical protein
LKVRENLNAARKLGVAFFFLVLLFFDSEHTWSRMHRAVTHFVRVLTIGLSLLLLYTSENEENVAQRMAVLWLTVLSTCMGLTLFIANLVFPDEDSAIIISSAIRCITYFAINLLLFITAFQDYRHFGTGLKEYYKKRHSRRFKL